MLISDELLKSIYCFFEQMHNQGYLGVRLFSIKFQALKEIEMKLTDTMKRDIENLNNI